MTEEKTNPLVCACRKALELAIMTVECASIDIAEGPTKGAELPWYKAARDALAQPCPMPPPWDAMIDDGERMRLLYLATLAERDEARKVRDLAREASNRDLEAKRRAEAEVRKFVDVANQNAIQREVFAADLAEALVALKPFGKWQEVSADLKAQTREVMPYAGSVFDRAAAVLAKHQTEGKDA